MKKLVAGLLAATATLSLVATATVVAPVVSAQAAAPSANAVLTTYADIAHAGYEDSLITAKQLKSAVTALVKAPSEATLKAARDAWIVARVPYMQTEAFRFGNKIVDEWEGKVNAWPLDEGLIDYVDASYAGGEDNAYAKANVIANAKITVGGATIDASKITKALLADKLQEVGGAEANVATGYHAIEFLLWGQDLNGTDAGAGDRKYTDFSTTGCTNGDCARRAEYLMTVTDLLIDDLTDMVKAWAPKGAARAEAMVGGEKAGFARILTGLGSLSYGELAGERMKLGLMLHDPEEEHDCFSDNTHNSHYYDALGIVNVYNGSYKRIDGTTVSGPSLADYVGAKAPEAEAKVKAAMDDAMAKFATLKNTAEGGMAYDQMIGAGNAKGNAIVAAAVDGLVEQKKALEGVVAALGLTIEIEGSDSLDAPDKVGK